MEGSGHPADAQPADAQPDQGSTGAATSPRPDFGERLERIVMAAGRALAVAGLLLLVFFAVMTNADGLMRFFLDSPIDAVRDLGGNVVAISAACCIPYAVLERSHITMKFVGRAFGPRANFYADLFGGVVAEIVLIGIGYEFFLYGLHSYQNGDTTWMLGVPTAPFWFVVDGVFWFAVLAEAVMVARIVRIGRGLAPAGAPAQH